MTSFRSIAVAGVLALVTSGCTVYGWGWEVVGTTGDTNTPTEIGTNRLDVDAGAFHTCWIDDDRALWCQGGDDWGQMGTGVVGTTAGDTQIGTDTDWAAVDAGWVHTCALKLDHTLWCWGAYPHHLTEPDGSVITPSAPAQVGTQADWQTVSAGGTHTCGIRSDQSLWCWGRNDNGAVGDGTAAPVTAPVQIGTASWQSVAAGLEATCGTQVDGTLWCWGIGVEEQPPGNPIWATRTAPTLISASVSLSDVSGFDNSFCGLDPTGGIWCWGTNFDNHLGLGEGNNLVYAPARVGTDAWRRVENGFDHQCAIAMDWSLWCWGDNDRGEIGDGLAVDQPLPVLVDDSGHWIDIAAGSTMTTGISI